jgi:hypothetical protein
VQNIKVTRYTHPKATGWAGYIEPEDGSWIAFVGLDGVPRFFLNRDPQTGAILPDDPSQQQDHLLRLREEGGLRIGMANDGSSVSPPGERNPLEIGERVFPLGFDGGGGDVVPLKA